MLMPHSYASSDFLDVVLEALEGVETRPSWNYDAVADNADLSVALDLAVLHVAARDRA